MKLLKALPILFALLFVGCIEDTNQAPVKSVEEGAERTKEAIDKFSERAKEFLGNEAGQIDKIKSLIDTLATKGKDIEKLVKEKGPEWKEKLENLENSEDFKQVMEKFEGTAKEVLEQLEVIAKDAGKTVDKPAK